MANLQDDLQVASFRGVPFYWRSVSTNGGRKTVSHEFPKKNTRFVEDLGLLDKSFAIEATIDSTNYKQNRDSLILALEGNGSADFVHPTLGTFECQVINYTLNEDITDLGNAKFTISFEKTVPNIFPKKAKNNQAGITTKSEELFAKTKTNISDNFKSPKSKFKAFTDAKNKVQSFTSKAKEIAKKFNQVSNKISEFSNAIDDAIQDINTLVTAPAKLAAMINDIITQGQNLFNLPSDIFAYYNGLFDYGDDDVSKASNTQERTLINDNRRVLNDNIQVAALSGAYQSIVNLSFLTTADIENTRNIIEDQYTKIINNDLIDYETKEVLQDLRNEVETFLEQKEQVSSNISQLQVYNEPITVLVYRLYGNIDKTESIIDLNSIKQLSFIDEQINILSE